MRVLAGGRPSDLDERTEGELRLVEAILADIKGPDREATAAARVRWLLARLPRTASLLGIDTWTTR